MRQQQPWKRKRTMRNQPLHPELHLTLPKVTNGIWLQPSDELYDKLEQYRQTGNYDTLNQFCLTLIEAQLEEIVGFSVIPAKEEAKSETTT